MDPCPHPHAAVLDGFGPPERIAYRAMRRMPVPVAGEVLVRIEASSVNAIEWKMRRGLGAPRWLWSHLLGPERVPGIDFAGRIVAVGPGGDAGTIGREVMGIRPYAGTHADLATIRLDRAVMVEKPGHVGFAKAGVVPFAGLVALKALNTRMIRGGRVLIVGASGGVGHIAVQMAKRCLKADLVVGICSSANRDFVRVCGADCVITREELPAPAALLEGRPDRSGTFDLIVDAAGDDRWWTDVAPHLLHAHGGFSAVALPRHGERPGEDAGLIGASLQAGRLACRWAGGRYSFVGGLLGALKDEALLRTTAGWLGQGLLAPKIAAVFPLAQLADAHRLIEREHTAGKISIVMS